MRDFHRDKCFRDKIRDIRFQDKKNLRGARFDQLAFENRDTRIRGNRLFRNFAVRNANLSDSTERFRA